jgi:hypothetical protein
MTIVEPEAATAPPAAEDPRTSVAIDDAPQPLCTALGGQCVEHEDDHGEIIHKGPEHTAAGPYGDHLLTHQLMQFGNAAPTLIYVDNFGWSDLNSAAVDSLIADTQKQLGSLCKARQHLAAAEQQWQLNHGVPLAVVRSEWERVRISHNPRMGAGHFSCSFAGMMRPVAVVDYNREVTSAEELRAYLDRLFGPHRVEYTSAVADALAGFEEVRRADLDPKVLKFWDEVEQEVIASDDPKACVARIADLLAGELASTGGAQ